MARPVVASHPSPALTSAVLQDRLHGALPVRSPANAGRAGYLVFSGPPALPEVHLVMVVNEEESCEVRAGPGHEGLFTAQRSPDSLPAVPTVLSPRSSDGSEVPAHSFLSLNSEGP